MGCVASIGVGVAGTTPETDVNFKNFRMENFRHMHKRTELQAPCTYQPVSELSVYG